MDKPLQDELITDSGLKLYIDPSYRKEWASTVTAVIAELPIKVNHKEQKILDHLKVGDEVCVSYQVVSDFEYKGDGQQFMQATEDNDYIKEFYNGEGKSVRVYALPKRAGIKGAIWCGVYLDKKRDLIDGIQGTEEEVETWLSQFPFGKTDIYSFNNFFEYNKKDYWKCGLDQIFAKRVKGHLVAVGDRVICKPIEEDVPVELLQNIQHNSSVKIRYQDRGKVLTGGKEKGIKRDDIISFDPTLCEKYTFFGKDYFLINQNFVTGKWN